MVKSYVIHLLFTLCLLVQRCKLCTVLNDIWCNITTIRFDRIHLHIRAVYISCLFVTIDTLVWIHIFMMALEYTSQVCQKSIKNLQCMSVQLVD